MERACTQLTSWMVHILIVVIGLETQASERRGRLLQHLQRQTPVLLQLPLGVGFHFGVRVTQLKKKERSEFIT